MQPARPYAESCDQNREPILTVLRQYLQPGDRVLEIGSGTGQHAAFFSRQLSDIHWQSSDCEQYLPAIRAWLIDADPARAPAPLRLDVLNDDWPAERYQAVFTANTTHIMSWPAVEAMFTGIGQVLAPGGLLLQYGPFSYAGHHTSPSNERFDQWLKDRDPLSGVRDLDQLRPPADDAGLVLEQDIEMPVNNRLLVWRKKA